MLSNECAQKLSDVHHNSTAHLLHITHPTSHHSRAPTTKACTYVNRTSPVASERSTCVEMAAPRLVIDNLLHSCA